MLVGDRTRRAATRRCFIGINESPDRFMGINESPDRFIGKPTIQKTTASPFGRLGLCALTIWAAEYFARAGERSTIALRAEPA